jgi:hypothetical protein
MLMHDQLEHWTCPMHQQNHYHLVIIGKSSINGSFSMAMLVITRWYRNKNWANWRPFREISLRSSLWSQTTPSWLSLHLQLLQKPLDISEIPWYLDVPWYIMWPCLLWWMQQWSNPNKTYYILTKVHNCSQQLLFKGRLQQQVFKRGQTHTILYIYYIYMWHKRAMHASNIKQL